MWTVLWAIGKWIIGVAIKVALWSVANPLAAVTIGAVLQVGAVYLTNVNWSGAKIVATLVGTIGSGMLWTGAGSWLGGQILSWTEGLGQALGGTLTWWWWVQKAVGINPF